MQCYIDINGKQMDEVINKVNFAFRKVLQLTSDEATYRVRLAYSNLDKSQISLTPLSPLTIALKENRSKNAPPLAWIMKFIGAKFPDRDSNPFLRGASSYTTYLGLPEKITVYKSIGTSSWKKRKATLSTHFSNNLLGIKSYRYFRKNMVGNYIDIDEWNQRKDKDPKKRYYVLADKEKKIFESYSYSQDAIETELPTERFLTGGKINVTPKMRRFLAFRGFYLRKSTTSFDIPERDLIGQIKSKINVDEIIQSCLTKNFGGLVLYNDHFEYPGISHNWRYLAEHFRGSKFAQPIIRKFSYHLDDPDYTRVDQARMRALSKHRTGTYFGIVLQPGETQNRPWKPQDFDIHWKNTIHNEIETGYLKNSTLDISINV